jgi:hypothetical protein
MNVRGRGMRLSGVAAVALTGIAVASTQAASGRDAGVSVSMKRSDQRLVYGEKVKVRGRVAAAERGQQVALEYAARGRAFKTVKRARTGRDGRYALSAKPVRSGKLRVVTGEAAASRVRRVTVAARLAAPSAKHVKRGRRTVIRGRLRPGFAGRKVRIQLRKDGRWATVDRVRTRRAGRFQGSWLVQRPAGRYRARVLFEGDRRNSARVAKTRLHVYTPGQASYYGPGLYGNRTACGQTLTPGTLGVANRWLPCGTRVTFRYRGRSVTAPVIDRGPFHASRIWDLTYATKRRLGFGSTGTVWATR